MAPQENPNNQTLQQEALSARSVRLARYCMVENTNTSNAGGYTLEAFQRNCELLENGLGTDNKDPREDLTTFRTWIAWVEGPAIPREFTVHFYGITLRKVVTSLLTRKYQKQDDHVSAVKVFLLEVACLLGRKIYDYHDDLVPVLHALLDVRTSFYAKYGFPKSTPPGSVKVREAWKESISTDSVLDGKSPGGDWEVVAVDSISPTLTEIQVTWSSGVQEWISIDDSSRVAAFGSKTSEDPALAAALIAQSSTTPPAAEAPAASPEDDDAWRYDLGIGALIDAKDRSGSWFQACIMDIVEIETQPPAVVTTAPPATRTTSTPALSDFSEDSLVVSDSDDNNDKTPSDTQDGPDSKSGIDGVSCPPNLSSDRLLFLATSASDTDTEDMTVDQDIVETQTASTVASIIAPSVTRMARVAFLGWPEWYDEWVCIAGIWNSENAKDRSAPINTQSFGNRGEYPVREEIKLLANYTPVPNDTGAAAYSRNEVLFSPFHASLVETFIESSGFQHLEQYWNSVLTLQKEGRQHFYIPNTALASLAAVGLMAEVLSAEFLQLSFNYSEIRNIPVESMEAALQAFEAMILAALGRSANNADCDTLRVKLALQLIGCPYLNRRLGGLKLLTDMVHRMNASKEYPSGLKITKSAGSHPKLEKLSFQVINGSAIASPNLLCELIVDQKILHRVFVGEYAHASLMQRTSDILIFLAVHNFITSDILSLLWQVGYVQGEVVALQVLQEIIKYLSVAALRDLLEAVRRIQESGVTVVVTDIVSAVTIRCRAMLLHDSEEDLRMMEVMSLHNQSLLCLWSWAEDGSAVSEAVALHCVELVEAAIDLGVSALYAMENANTFRWHYHWARTELVVARSLKAVEECASTILALKTLRSFLMSWLKDADKIEVANLPNEVPFRQPIRYCVVDYLQTKFHLTTAVSTSLLHLKHAHEKCVSNLVAETPQTNPSSEYFATLNEMMIGQSRCGYKTQLDTCLDFIQFLSRSSLNCSIEYSIIRSLWDRVLLRASTPEERDAVLTFVSRLIISRYNATSKPPEGAASVLRPRRLSQCTHGEVYDIYDNLLCNESFIVSSHFGQVALSCVEKYFKWMCVDNDSIIELPGKSTMFIITKPMSKMDNWKISMNCVDDTVAAEAAKFITLFPQRLSSELRAQGEAVALRKIILSLCMEEFACLRRAAHNSSNFSICFPLRRTLMVLNALLDESMAECGTIIVPHGRKWKNFAINIKIKCTGKNLHSVPAAFVANSCDALEDTLKFVANTVSRKLSEVKIFRGGKELTIGSARRTLFQSGFSESEVLLVGERQGPKEAAKENEKALDDLLLGVRADVSSLPVMLISDNPEYFTLLFDLLNMTSGSVCNELWEFIMRIPTASSVLNYWRNFQLVSADYQFSNLFSLHCDGPGGDARPEALNSSVITHSGLTCGMYNLQVIEMFLHNIEQSPPAVSAMSESEQKTWCEHFLLHGGLICLCESLATVLRTAQNFLHDPSHAVGVSPHLLVSSFELVSRILRSSFLRLSGLLATKEQRVVIATALRQFSDGGDEAAVEDFSANVSLYDFFAQEWGDRLNLIFPVHHNNENVQQSARSQISKCDMPQLQHSVLECFRQVALFASREGLWSTPKIDDSPVGEHIKSICSNLLAVWSSIAISSPECLLNIRSSNDGPCSSYVTDARELLSTLLFYREDSSANKLPCRIAIWSEHAILAISSLLDKSVPKSAHARGYFVNGMLLTLLSLRPSVTTEVKQIIKQSSDAVNSEALFQLATMLIDCNPQSDILNITSTRDIVTQMINELRESYLILAEEFPECTGEQRLSHEIKNLSGALKLMISLVSPHEALKLEIRDQHADFLFECCLGITQANSVRFASLCLDDKSRASACGLLITCLATDKTDADLAINSTMRVLGRCYEVHKTLPEMPMWGYMPETMSRGAANYVGLRNMGCTCYMNSLFQALYMQPAVRAAVLSAAVDESLPESELEENLLLHLQNMFMFLTHSMKKSYSPDGWMKSFKDETGNAPVNVLQQQDALEFLQTLFDRLEHQLTSSSGFSVLQSIFGGHICNQMFQEALPDAGIREMNEPFVCVSLDVQGMKSLENSLQKFVQGEKITDFQWKEGEPRVDIVKRQCLGDLSDSLIFHLKRFELNFDTFRREKVNDYFSFPNVVDLYPYTREGLAKAPVPDRPADYYLYELTGIIIHRGTTDSGHYFSYIKESQEDAQRQHRSERRWIEFNDSEVTYFNEVRIPAESFGGSTLSHDLIASTQQWTTSHTVNPQNAYMLIYSRVRPIAPQHAEITPTPRTQEMYSRVIADNQAFILSCRVFSKPYVDCLHVMNRLLMQQSFDISHSVDISAYLKQYVRFVFSSVAKMNYTKRFCTICEELRDVLNIHSYASEIESDISDEETQAMKLSLEPLNSPVTMVDRIKLNAKKLLNRDLCCAIARQLFSEYAEEFDCVMHILFSPDSLVRNDFAHTLHVLLCNLIDVDGVKELATIPDAILHANRLSCIACNMFPNCTSEEEKQVEHYSAAHPSPPPVKSEDLRSLGLISRILLQLTFNEVFDTIIGEWRRSDALQWLLYQIALQHTRIRIFMLKRQVVAQLGDIFLGEQSLLLFRTPRKRVPTSYVSVIPDKTGALPASARAIPNWTHLMHLMAELVCCATTDAMKFGRGVPPTYLAPRDASITLDPWSNKIIQSRPLYSTALYQARYAEQITRIMVHNSYESLPFSNSVSEILFESLSSATVESTAHLFASIEKFLLISDSAAQHRATMLFGIKNGIPELLNNMKVAKANYVCVCIRSMIELLRVPVVATVMSEPPSKISEWACWMLKFCYQFNEKCIKDAFLNTKETPESKQVPNEEPSKAGPYILVYGESEEEREQTWQQRAERTFQLLQTTVRRLGGDPDNLIPTDAFEEVLPEPVADSNYMDMSLNEDEELARIIQNSLNDVPGLD